MQYSHIRLISLILLLPSLIFSAPVAGKVGLALNECERQKKKDSKWSPLGVGAHVYQTDRLRTGRESELVIRLLDGSAIRMAEFTYVEMSQILVPKGDGTFDTRIKVDSGVVNFAVKKQKKNSTFKFKTSGTHTASIRGTEGFVGSYNNVFAASLVNGKLEVEDGDTPVLAIGAGETIFGTDSLVSMKLASSGDPKFAKRLSMIMQSGKDMGEMLKDVKAADEAVQQEKKKAAVDNLPENGFTLNTDNAVEVCNEGLALDGVYRTSDPNAKLVVKMGKHEVSENLATIADGQSHPFAYNVAVSDENGLWKEAEAELVFVSGKVKDSKKVSLKVNPACRGVNRIAPQVRIASYDSTSCKVQVVMNGMQDDVGILAQSIDGTSVSEEAISKNGLSRFKLSSGIHEYEYVLKDQAGNVGSAKKKMGCYPVRRFNVEVFGGPREELIVPPPPYGLADRISKMLEFRIRTPENDPQFLYKVTVKQNGKVILQETLTQIQTLDYQIPVELVRGARNKFDIEVIHKSGFRSVAVKKFEVR